MSTRCNIHFTFRRKDEEVVVANIYRHSDGYPEKVLPDLDRFFAEVEKQTKDTRFGDPSYLAAKFVVWQAGEYAKAWHFDGEEIQPLDFLSLGIMSRDAGDAEYIYTVSCNGPGRPEVSYKEA